MCEITFRPIGVPLNHTSVDSLSPNGRRSRIIDMAQCTQFQIVRCLRGRQVDMRVCVCVRGGARNCTRSFVRASVTQTRHTAQRRRGIIRYTRCHHCRLHPLTTSCTGASVSHVCLRVCVCVAVFVRADDDDAAHLLHTNTHVGSGKCVVGAAS